MQHAAPKTVAVAGAGIAGLSAAHHLSRLLPSTRIVLLEREQRAGGWLRSVTAETESPDWAEEDLSGSLLFEAGPRSIRPSGLAGWLTLELVRPLVTSIAR